MHPDGRHSLAADGFPTPDGSTGAIVLWGVAGLATLLVLIWVVAGFVHSRRSRRHEPPPPPAEHFPRPNPVITESGTLAPPSLRRAPEPQRYSWDEPRSHRRLSRWPIAFATVAVLAAVAGGMTWLQRDRTPGQRTVAACADTLLRVVAAPEIAPVIEEAARALTPEDADCSPVYVTAEEPSTTAQAAQKPDVWIPSSSAWLAVAAADGTTYDAKGAPLAHSPIVLAAPEKTAALFAEQEKTSWAALVDSVSKQRVREVSMPDPVHNTIGMLSVYAVQKAMNATTPDKGIAQLRALTLRARLKDPNIDPAALLRTNPSEVFPTTEQQLEDYNRDRSGGDGLTAVYPQDAVVEADYPFAVARGSADKVLAARLRNAVSEGALTAAGFQTEPTPQALSLPKKPAELVGPALAWAQYRTLPFQVLLLIDRSGSMNQTVVDKTGKRTTKAALLRESGANANKLFGEDTSIGMWYFASPTPDSPPHVEAVPVAPMDSARRKVMGEAMAGYQAVEDAGTPLFRTVLDGVTEMRAKVREGTVTIVIVLTDGQDEKSDFAMTQQEFLAQLGQDADPKRPVPVIAVGLGEDADMTALEAMAQATGGQAISATNPADVASAIAQAFLAAHAPR